MSGSKAPARIVRTADGGGRQRRVEAGQNGDGGFRLAQWTAAKVVCARALLCCIFAGMPFSAARLLENSARESRV